jgi:hypothetical protein
MKRKMNSEALEAYMRRELDKMLAGKKYRDLGEEEERHGGSSRLVARDIAIANGDKTYYGRPCHRGHDGKRVVKTHECYHCCYDRAFKNEQRRLATLKRKSHRIVEMVEQEANDDQRPLPVRTDAL